ncbi:MAG TPA: protoporphyrinogen oxidase [Acidimicrobiales bacterium]|nr:protoporphyrinogen oxidase [Acidimicrobiales bacterium]
MTSVAVVGGGIAGLAAAWELLGAGADVTVLEAGDRLGGRIRTGDVAGRPVDLGPDALLARVPDALALCAELGLEDELVHPAAEGAAIWSGGRLRPLPPGLVLGAPAGAGELVALVRNGLVSPAGAARAALDLVRPATRWPTDPTVGEVVGGRLGPEVHVRVVDPLLAGIHAGPSALLSARSVAPQLAAAMTSRSLLLGLRARRSGAARPGAGKAAVFASLRGGLGRLVERLEQELRAGGATITLGAAVDRAPVEGFDATVVAAPAPAAAAMVEEVAPDAAASLRAVEYASVVLAVLVYPAAALPAPLAGSGFLVPATENRLLTACSFGSAKWPHWAGPNDLVLRVSAGRWGDDRALALGDDDLCAQLHDELVAALGLREPPRLSVVTRYPEALPQYRSGHLARVERAEAALAAGAPTVILTGAAYRGLGIAACISQGRSAARRAMTPGGQT